MDPLKFNGNFRRCLGARLQRREELLGIRDVPTQSEMCHSLGNPLAEVLMTVMTPVPKMLMGRDKYLMGPNVDKMWIHPDDQLAMKPKFTIAPNEDVCHILTQEGIIDIGEKIQKKLDNELEYRKRKAMDDTRSLMQLNCCHKLDCAVKIERDHQLILNQQLTNGLQEKFQTEKDLLSQCAEQQRYKILEFMYDRFQKQLVCMIQEALQREKQRTSEVQAEKIQHELSLQADYYNRFINESVRDQRYADIGLIQKLWATTNETLGKQRNKLYCKEMCLILTEVCRMKIQTDNELINLAKECLGAIKMMYDQIDLLANCELTKTTSCPYIDDWRSRCLCILSHFETLIEHTIDRHYEHGRFFIPILDFIKTQGSEDFHMDPFYECIYRGGHYNEYQEMKNQMANHIKRPVAKVQDENVINTIIYDNKCSFMDSVSDDEDYPLEICENRLKELWCNDSSTGTLCHKNDEEPFKINAECEPYVKPKVICPSMCALTLNDKLYACPKHYDELNRQLFEELHQFDCICTSSDDNESCSEELSDTESSCYLKPFMRKSVSQSALSYELSGLDMTITEKGILSIIEKTATKIWKIINSNILTAIVFRQHQHLFESNTYTHDNHLGHVTVEQQMIRFKACINQAIEQVLPYKRLENMVTKMFILKLKTESMVGHHPVHARNSLYVLHKDSHLSMTCEERLAIKDEVLSFIHQIINDLPIGTPRERLVEKVLEKSYKRMTPSDYELTFEKAPPYLINRIDSVPSVFEEMEMEAEEEESEIAISCPLTEHKHRDRMSLSLPTRRSTKSNLQIDKKSGILKKDSDDNKDDSFTSLDTMKNDRLITLLERLQNDPKLTPVFDNHRTASQLELLSVMKKL